ncbi:MAG: hypothetical protein IJW45_08615 [Oscillospiraceae bacterium]|nr:hypothetical protein [Oscillospiraceae bacterium]
MGYRIEYGKIAVKKQIRPKGAVRRIGAWVVVTLVLGHLLLPYIKQVFWDLIIPGENDVTIHALEVMAEELEGGATLAEAAECFCRELVENGQ